MNYCDVAGGGSIAGLGLGVDGGLAEYIAVDTRRLIDIGNLDPARAVPLTDAALTSWHAIKQVVGRLPDDGHVLVIGIGG
jgi:propanol-preferring alcohol dehydrogenase